jgi:hypothetical protein
MKTKNRKMDIDEPSQPISVPEQKPRLAVCTMGPKPAIPVCEIQRSNWVVENYVNHPEVLKLEECTMKQIVYVSKCVNSTIFVDCKVK